MLTVVEPVNDTATYWKLDDRLQPVECNRAEWDAFRKTGAHVVAKTYFGGIASVETEFDGLDHPEDDDPFMTVVGYGGHIEAEAHQTWEEAERVHRERVDELKALLAARWKAEDPQMGLL